MTAAETAVERCEERTLVDQHFAGTIAPTDERRMRDHLVDCARCHKYYGRHLVLAELDPTAMPNEERVARGLGIAAREKRVARLFPVAASVLAVAAVLFLVLRPGSRAADDSSFTPRGGAPSIEQPAVAVYLAPPSSAEPLTPAPSSLKASDELAFAYRNVDAKTHLMIFGVDERGQVFWFYPAWTSAAETPTAIPIATDTETHELRDAVRHRFERERLEIHGLFVDRPIDVHEVEAAVRGRATTSGPIAISGAIDHVTPFVTPR